VHHPSPHLRSFETKLGNPSLTRFALKQDAGCRCVFSHHFHSLVLRCKLTNLLPWFWGTNEETVTVILRPKSPNYSSGFEAKLPNRWPWFWGSNQEIVEVLLKPNHWQTVTIGFEAKLGNPYFLSPPRVRCGSHMASPNLPIVRPPSTWLVPDHPRSSAPSLLLIPQSSLLLAMSHSPPTYHETSNHVSLNRITQYGVSSTEMHRFQIQTKPCQLLITQINQGINHLISQRDNLGKRRRVEDKTYLFCADSESIPHIFFECIVAK
jgi:hypothetical protein